MNRRNLLASLLGTMAAGCTKIGETAPFAWAVDQAEGLHRVAHRAMGGQRPLAREYPPSAISPDVRGNGSTDVPTPLYRAHQATGFVDWRLNVGGLVERPLSLSIADIRALPQRTQITRHDCVEGWSAIGQWTGPQLGPILDRAGLLPDARYILFHCADLLYGAPYYESCDLADAFHPQTIIAHRLNDEPLPVKNGAPLRLRLERQLGYKHAKYLTGIEAITRLEGFGGGNGGFWEDRGYQWYAGI